MKNGRDLGVAFHLPPGTKGPFFPAVAFKNAQVCEEAYFALIQWSSSRTNLVSHWPSRDGSGLSDVPCKLAAPENILKIERIRAWLHYLRNGVK